MLTLLISNRTHDIKLYDNISVIMILTSTNLAAKLYTMVLAIYLLGAQCLIGVNDNAVTLAYIIPDIIA